jgi:hypothetical protein
MLFKIADDLAVNSDHVLFVKKLSWKGQKGTLTAIAFKQYQDKHPYLVETETPFEDVIDLLGQHLT